MRLTQIVALLSVPLCIAAAIGIICLWSKNKLLFFFTIIILGGCVFWRLETSATSDRYAFVLVLPAIILCGYAGQIIWNDIICFHSSPKKHLLITCYVFALVGTLGGKALHVHSMQVFYINAGQTIKRDTKKCAAPITMDFSNGNALRFYMYSNRKTVQENPKDLSSIYADQIINQKARNYSQVFDSVYLITIITQEQEKKHSLNKTFKHILKLQTNSKKERYVNLYKYITKKATSTKEDYHIFWSEDMSKAVEHPKVMSHDNKKISVPSGKLMKDWSINLSDGANLDSMGVIELKQDEHKNNILYMSSENKITIQYNPLFPIDKEKELRITYRGLSESVIAVKIYLYDEKKQFWLETRQLESLLVNKMTKEAVLRCRIDPDSISNAYFFRIALSVQRGDVNFYNIEMCEKTTITEENK